MKSIHALPPLFALIIVGSIMAIQRQAIATLEHEKAELPRHTDPSAIPDTAAELFPELEKRRSKQTNKMDGPLDWRNLAEVMEKSGVQAASKALEAFKKRVQAMSNEELIANIEDIMKLDLTESQKSNLLTTFFDTLVDRAPEFALRHLFLSSARKYQAVSSAWVKWSTSDPAAATGWLDEQISAGTIDPKSLHGNDGLRIPFEAHLVKLLLTSDPAAAIQRVENLNPDWRDHVIRQCAVSEADAPTKKAWTELVRSQLPKKVASEMIADKVPHWIDDGMFSQVTDYMESISATAEERTACIQQATQNYTHASSYKGTITIEGIESFRTWAEAQEPGSSRNLTRDAISNMLRGNGQSKMTLESVTSIVAHYQALEGGDEMLAQALSHAMDGKKDYVRALATMIQDDGKRAKILKKLETW